MGIYNKRYIHMTIQELELLIKTTKVSQLGGLSIKINNDKNLLNLIKQRTHFLESEINNTNRFYYIKNDLYEIKKCKYCNNNLLVAKNNFCSNKCNIKWHYKYDNWGEKSSIRMKNTCSLLTRQEIKSLFNFEKAKKTCLEKYGVDHNFKSTEIKENRKKTWLTNLGVDNPNKSKKIRNKIKETNLKRYNNISPLNGKDQIEKKKNTWIKNLGVDNPSKNEIVKKKKQQTCFKNHGCLNPSQNSLITEKQRKTWLKNKIDGKHKNFKYKIFTFESGRKIICQGDEIKALNEWILKKYNEDDIINDISFMNKLKFIYYDNSSVIKERLYIPDFYIKSVNLIIEVKSKYIYDKTLNSIEKKTKAVLNKNYNFILLLNNGKKFITKTYEEIKSDLEKIS